MVTETGFGLVTGITMGKGSSDIHTARISDRCAARSSNRHQTKNERQGMGTGVKLTQALKKFQGHRLFSVGRVWAFCLLATVWANCSNLWAHWEYCGGTVALLGILWVLVKQTENIVGIPMTCVVCAQMISLP